MNKEIDECKKDITKFIEKLCGFKLYPYQKDIIEKLINMEPNERLTIVKPSRAVGYARFFAALNKYFMPKSKAKIIIDDFEGE